MAAKKSDKPQSSTTVAPAAVAMGGTETYAELKAKMDALKARDGDTLLGKLRKLESEAEEIRDQLKGMGVPVPPRINVEASEEDTLRVILTLYKVPNNAGMNLGDLETITGYKGAKMGAIRRQLESEPASIKYTAKKLAKMVSLTQEGLKEAEEAAATDEGKQFLAELEAEIAKLKAAQKA